MPGARTKTYTCVSREPCKQSLLLHILKITNKFLIDMFMIDVVIFTLLQVIRRHCCHCDIVLACPSFCVTSRLKLEPKTNKFNLHFSLKQQPLKQTSLSICNSYSSLRTATSKTNKFIHIQLLFQPKRK